MRLTPKRLFILPVLFLFSFSINAQDPSSTKPNLPAPFTGSTRASEKVLIASCSERNKGSTREGPPLPMSPFTQLDVERDGGLDSVSHGRGLLTFLAVDA